MRSANIVRRTSHGQSRAGNRRNNASLRQRREVLIRTGGLVLRARLLDTVTAHRVWSALPIYSTAETWGGAVHFETHVETGREANAKTVVSPGDIAFWVERDRILIGFGPTPISSASEIRLPSPCNVWAMALDDVAALAAVRPGQQIAVLEAEP